MSHRARSLMPVGAALAAALAVAALFHPRTARPQTPPAPSCDADNDGYKAATHACGGNDCDDGDPERHPGGVEFCSGTLPSGRSAADHDEDCQPCTVFATTIDGDGDDDHDGFASVACTNPWMIGSAGPLAPRGCDAHLPRSTTAAKGRVLGLDCDALDYVVVPGAQVCKSATAVQVCLPSGDWRVLPRTSLKPPPPPADERGFATVACPTGTTCRTQPNGLGACQ